MNFWKFEYINLIINKYINYYLYLTINKYINYFKINHFNKLKIRSIIIKIKTLFIYKD